MGASMPDDPDGVVIVPRYQGRLTRLSRDRRATFLEHLRRIIWEAVEAPGDARRKQYLGGPNPAQADFAVWACTACGGDCCSKGGTHAYLDDETIKRVASERHIRSRRTLSALYEQHLPDESHAGSCVFHAAEGCTLPRELRSDLCNRFYCTPLRRLFQNHEDPHGTRIIAQGGRNEDNRP